MAFLFKKIIRLIKTYFIIVGFLTTLFLSLGIFLLLSSEHYFDSKSFITVPHLKGDKLIHLRWSGTLHDSQTESSPFDIVLSNGLDLEGDFYIPHMETYLKELGDDHEVKGLVIELGHLEGGLAVLSELRDVLKNFKKRTQKPIYFWFTHGDTKSYYLASVGDEILMAPGHKLLLLGPMVNSIYFGDALKRLGVNIEVLKTGTYKSAFEPFVSNEPSEASIFMYDEFIKSVKENLIQDLSQSLPQLTRDALEKAFKTSIIESEEAVKAHLITQVSYFHEAKSKYETFHKAKLQRYSDYVLTKSRKQKESPSYLEEDEKGIALIEAIGTITDSFDDSMDQSLNPHSIIKEIHWAKEDKNVKAVVMRVNSPGGSATASDLIWEELRLLALEKPLVVSMGDVAASGGYYISAPAHKIFANANTITGSIGVISMIANFKNFKEKYGISFFLHSDSDRKDLFDMGKEASEADKEFLKMQSDKTYHDFISKVSLGRKIPYAHVAEVAEGRIWTGSQAKNLKLVDEIGSLKDAIIEAKLLAGFTKEKEVPLYEYSPEIRSFMDCFHSSKNRKHCFNYGKNALFLSKSRSSFNLENLSLSTFNHYLKPLLQKKEPLAYCKESLSFE